MKFKIYGERNSGTNFLEKILKNSFYIETISNIILENNITKRWKHELPKIKKENNIIHFFIIRNLKEWLISMYNNPYELIPEKI